MEPPRRPPFGLELALLFGGVIGQAGWLIAFLGVVGGRLFLSYADTGFTTYGARARGVVEDVATTSVSEDRQPVLAYSYRFRAPDGRETTGVSYSTDGGLSAGDMVTIELDRADPRTSRIEGMRSGPFGAWALLVLLVPLVGIAGGAVGLARGSRTLSLVRLGSVGTARVVELTLVHVAEDGDRTYRVVLEHEVDGVRHRMMMDTGRTDLTVGSEQAILYERTAPERSALVDELRGCRVGPGGALITDDVLAGGAYLVLPAAAVVSALIVAIAALV